MPYAIRKQGDKFKLVKKDSGETMGTHDSRASAMAQMKAIYASEGAAAKKGMMEGMYGDHDMVSSMPMAFIPQDDPRANYDPLGGNKSFACANCEWFQARQASCQLVCGDIVPTGYCDLWTRELSPEEMDADRAMPVRMVEKSIVEKVKEAVQDVLGLKAIPLDFASGFKTFGPDNKYWVAFWSNNAQDRDGEWFAEKAHDQYVERVANGDVPYPKLWYWHQPQLESGQAFYVDRIGHCMVAVGEFFDTPVANHMKAYFAKGTDDGVSHGYLYPRSMLVDHVYYDYNTFEISPLPAEVASNPHTTFVSAQEILNMPLSANQKEALRKRLGADFVDQLYAAGEIKSKAMEQVVTDFKSHADNPLEASVKALESKFDLLLAALATETKAGKTDKKKGEEGSPEEEGSESEEEAAAEGDKPKGKKKQAATPTTAVDPTVLGVLQGMDKSIKALTAAIAPLQADVKGIKEQFDNPVSATRSPYTVVPPTDPAMDALAKQYIGGGDPTLAPGTAQQPGMENIADINTIFGGTQLGAFLNGNHG